MLSLPLLKLVARVLLLAATSLELSWHKTCILFVGFISHHSDRLKPLPFAARDSPKLVGLFPHHGTGFLRSLFSV